MRKLQVVGLAVAVLTTAATLVATTWTPSEVTCPICHTKNKFRTIMSYGSYVYGWPSKFQMVYWPSTDESSVYTCKECHLSAFMWDFEKIPADKLEAIRHSLQSTNIDSRENYTQIPMSQRLEVAEKVYGALDKDDQFWSHFYRVKAYHLAREKKLSEAAEARAKALAIVRRMINDPSYAGQKKELLVVSAAMHHFLQDDDAAKDDLKHSLAAHFENSSYSAEQNQNANHNLDALAKEYMELMGKHKVPNDDGSDRLGSN